MGNSKFLRSRSETSDMAILLSVVFGLLLYPIHVAGLTLCDTDGTQEVVESTASNVFTCTGAVSTDTISWILQRSNGNIALATCPPASCNNPYKPQFEASRPAGDRSTFTVNGSTTSYLQYIQGQTIVCRTNPGPGSPGSPQQTQCTVDVVAVPSVTCDAHYNTGTSSPWTVTVNCSVSGAYSYLNRYTCNLIQTSPTTNSLGSGNLIVTSTSGSGGKYKTGYCQVTVPYPDVTGVYSYKMAVTPGRQDVPASFGGQSSIGIKRPITPPSHNCPQYVRESQGTSCMCTATDLGQPAGVVRWTSTMTNQLSLSNVNETENGTTYTCDVMWNGQRTQSVTYTLQVAYGPSSVSITHLPFPYDTNGQQQLTLTCSASDVNPAPTFTWVKGSADNVVGQGRTYTFRRQPPGDDNSVFVCRAVNSITGTSRQDSTTSTLNYPPTQNPVITNTSTPSNSEGHFHQGDKATLTCAVTGGKPFGATTVTFTCPGKQDSPDIVGTSGVTSTVTFDSLTASDHDKVCTCTTKWKNTNWYNKNETVKLFVRCKTSSAGALGSGSISTGAAVGIVAAVMAVLFAVVIVVYFVWLWRREWVLPCAEANSVHKDGEMEQGGRHDTQQQQDQPPQFDEPRSQRDTGVYELQDTGEPNTPNVTGRYSTPSDYDLPQTSGMRQRSVYTSLSSPRAAGDTGPSYVNTSETGPVYVNNVNSKTDSVYVNKDNPKTDPVYVNKDNPKTDPVYVNKDNPKTDPVYVNKDNPKTDPVYVNKDNAKTDPVYVNKGN